MKSTVSEIQIIDFLEGELKGKSKVSLHNFLLNMSRTRKLLSEYRDLKRALRSLDTADKVAEEIDMNRLHNKIMLEIRMGEAELDKFDRSAGARKVNPIYKSKKRRSMKSARE